MHVEAQTKKLAQTVFLFSASSLCAILVCMAATNRSHGTLTPPPDFQVYTYQNPFSNLRNHAPMTIVPEARNILTRIATPQFLVGVSSLGCLWLASTIHLQDRKHRKHLHRKIVPIANPEPKMNPLAILPPLAANAQKGDNSCKSVFGRTTTLCSERRRKRSISCGSRFQPSALVLRQSRVGYL